MHVKEKKSIHYRSDAVYGMKKHALYSYFQERDFIYKSYGKLKLLRGSYNNAVKVISDDSLSSLNYVAL